MIENRKQMVSLRVGVNELNKVRGVARRLRVRDSDVFRFALKVTLGRLGMLHDESVVGRDLLPVFMEVGTELVNHFHLDAEMLERLINERAQEGQKVDWHDVELVTLAGGQDRYAYLRLRKLVQGHDENFALPGVLQKYMYEKYMSGESGAVVAEQSRLLAVSNND
jgi:hypothetical protein